jgi:hypothetical protein
MTDQSELVLQALSRNGLLLVQDKQLPNVVTLLTGESPRGSWWGHPKGRLIFAVLDALDDHPDVLFTKLLHGKQTLVGRALWPEFLTVASAGEPWQLHGLSAAARRLLDSVNEQQDPVRASGAAVKELEARLLAHAHAVHTEKGQHEVMVQPWAAWARQATVKPLRSLAAAKQQLEDAATGIGADRKALPWAVSS